MGYLDSVATHDTEMDLILTRIDCMTLVDVVCFDR